MAKKFSLVKRKKKMCGAKITINGQVYTCEHKREDHDGPHVCRAYSKGSLIEGFYWDIDNGGQVDLQMPTDVAEQIFHIPASLL